MATPELGRIERVELSGVWPSENENFTPWMANHLDLLGEELGSSLEL